MHLSLQSLEIENFKAIRKPLRLGFSNLSPGLYFVNGINKVKLKLGANGAAKSTIFVDAPYWALTGKTSRSNRPGHFVESWNGTQQKTEVRLGFMLDDFFSISRSRNPSGLLCNNNVVDQSEIDNLIPLTDSALRSTLLISQFGDLFLDKSPEEKSRIFSQTLNLDVWLKVADKAGDNADACKKQIVKYEEELATLKGSINEAVDQFNILSEKEEQFEAETKQLIASKRESLMLAKLSAAERYKELDVARAKSSAQGSLPGDLKIRSNNLQTLLKQRRRSETEYQAALKVEENNYNQLVVKLGGYEKKRCPECGQTVEDTEADKRVNRIKDEQSQSRRNYKAFKENIGVLQVDISNLEKEVEEIEQNLTNYNDILNEISLAAEKSINADKEVHRVKKELQELQEKENPYTSQCDELEARIAFHKKQRESARECLDYYNKNMEIFKFWQKGYKEIRLEQIDTCLLELEVCANHQAEELGAEGYELKFDTERETKKGSISHGFSVLLYHPEHAKEPVPLESYSGGEEHRLQLACTFGLSEVLLSRSGITTDFEVLDEPTNHLSPEGIDDLLSCLSDRAAALNRRIFFIDQHSLDRGAFDGMITVTKEKDGVHVNDGGLGIVKDTIVWEMIDDDNDSVRVGELFGPVKKKKQERIRL